MNKHEASFFNSAKLERGRIKMGLKLIRILTYLKIQLLKVVNFPRITFMEQIHSNIRLLTAAYN